jgi:hypothetical protein
MPSLPLKLIPSTSSSTELSAAPSAQPSTFPSMQSIHNPIILPSFAPSAGLSATPSLSPSTVFYRVPPQAHVRVSRQVKHLVLYSVVLLGRFQVYSS